jgi:hypothetical protein
MEAKPDLLSRYVLWQRFGNEKFTFTQNEVGRPALKIITLRQLARNSLQRLNV